MLKPGELHLGSSERVTESEEPQQRLTLVKQSISIYLLKEINDTKGKEAEFQKVVNNVDSSKTN